MSKYHNYLANSACKRSFNRLLLTCCGYLALLGVFCHQAKAMTIGGLHSLFIGNNTTDTSETILAPGDFIIAIDPDSDSGYKTFESPSECIDDNTTTKYLNFGNKNSGFIVTPSSGPSIVGSFQITTANDSRDHDPASWVLFGTNDPISHPNEGPVAWWSCEDTNEVISGQPGMLYNGAGFAPGAMGKAFEFDGFDDFYAGFDSSAYKVPTNLTLMAWVYWEAENPQIFNAFFNVNNGYGGGYRLGVHNESYVNSAYFQTGDLGTTDLLGSIRLEKRRWYHIAATYDGETKRLYVNGFPDGSMAKTGDIVYSAGGLEIGRGDRKAAWAYYFAGRVDELKVFDRVLSPEEIASVYHNKTPEEEIVEMVTVGDLTGDEQVDARDVAVAALVWLEEDCGLSYSCGGSDVYPPGGDGDIDFRDLAVILSAWGYCVDPTNPYCVHLPLTMYEPPGTTGVNVEKVQLFSGEFYKSVVDLRIPGRDIDFVWARTYRSRTGKNSSMGNNWDHSNDIRLEAYSGNLVLHDGSGRKDIYLPQANGTWAARGFFREISQNPDGSFTMVFRDKSKWNFNSFGEPNAPGKINTMTDRNGNTLNFDYDALDRLVTIHDTLDTVAHNRDIIITYNADGLVESITDYAGRQVRYTYYDPGDPNGSAGDLKTVTMPAVTGTPNGNDFPAGKKTIYTYSKGFADERLNHNLLTITDPIGQTYLKNTYGTDSNDPNFDHVVRQSLGTPNDIIDYTYYRQVPEPNNNHAVTRTVINDRMGNVSEYFFSNRNELLVLRQYTGRANPDEPTGLNPNSNPPVNKYREDDPDYFETRYRYNKDYLPTRLDPPNGNYVVNVFESDIDPNAPPRSRGNLRRIHRLAGALAPVSDQNEIVELFEYDPNFNQGTNFPTRYINSRGEQRLYGYDDRGNRIRKTYKIPGPKPDIVMNFEYDERGNLTASIQPDNGSGYKRRDTYTYYTDANDPNYGYLKNVIIDGNNLALTTTYEYDRVGNVVRVIDPNGGDTQYIVNQLNQVVRRISRDVGGGVRYERDYHYDENNNLVRVDVQNKDEAGFLRSNTHLTTTYDYDAMNRLIRRTSEVDDGNSVVNEYEYDDNGNRTLVRYGEATNGNQPNNNVRIKSDERGLVFRRTLAEGDPCQSTTQYDYDRNGNLKKIISGLEGIPRITTLDSDGFGRLIATHDPMGNESEYHYDAAGNRLSKFIDGELVDIPGDGNNVRLYESRYQYDSLNRLIRSEVSHFDPNTQAPIGDGNSVTRFFYSDKGSLTRIINDRDFPTRYEYDTAGRRKVITDAKGNQVTYSYDKNSNVKSVTGLDVSDIGNPNEIFVTGYEYDALNRLTRTTDNLGNTTSYKYDSLGNRVSRIDAMNNETRYDYDGLGRRIRTIRDMDSNGADANDPCDIVTQRAYDDSGRLISSTDDNGNTTSFDYDALDRIKRVVYADGTDQTTVFDVHGNPVQSFDADGDFVVTLYDALDRVTHSSVTPGPTTAPTTTFEHYQYDGQSRLTSAIDAGAVFKARYDSLSNLTEETLNGRTTSYTYDGVGNMLSCTYPGGRKINYVYDELNRTSVAIDDADTDTAMFSYIGPGRIERRLYDNNTQCDYTYDPLRRLTGTTDVFDPAGANIVIDQRMYAWDAVHNKTQRKDIRPGGPQLTHDYVYDDAHRLVQTTVTDGNSIIVRQTSYDLDGVGNREEVIGSPDAGPWVGGYIMDPTLPEPGDFQMNQYTDTGTDSRQYDLNGNLSIVDNDDPGIISIKYDYRNRMVEYTNGATEQRHTYSYDPLGRRIARVVDADGIAGGPFETRYLYSGNRVIEEQNNTGTTLATYVHNIMMDEDVRISPRSRINRLIANTMTDGVLILRRGGQDYYYHGGDQGVMAVTESTGNAVERYRYADFGTPRIFNSQGQQINESAIDNPYMFKGLRHDSETGWYDAGSRYLDPVAGRPTTRGDIMSSGSWLQTGADRESEILGHILYDIIASPHVVDGLYGGLAAPYIPGGSYTGGRGSGFPITWEGTGGQGIFDMGDGAGLVTVPSLPLADIGILADAEDWIPVFVDRTHEWGLAATGYQGAAGPRVHADGGPHSAGWTLPHHDGLWTYGSGDVPRIFGYGDGDIWGLRPSGIAGGHWVGNGIADDGLGPEVSGVSATWAGFQPKDLPGFQPKDLPGFQPKDLPGFQPKDDPRAGFQPKDFPHRAGLGDYGRMALGMYHGYGIMAMQRNLTGMYDEVLIDGMYDEVLIDGMYDDRGGVEGFTTDATGWVGP